MFWLISDSLYDVVKGVDIVPAIKTDHSAITLQIQKIEDGEQVMTGSPVYRYQNSNFARPSRLLGRGTFEYKTNTDRGVFTIREGMFGTYTATTETGATQTMLTNYRAELKQKIPTFSNPANQMSGTEQRNLKPS